MRLGIKAKQVIGVALIVGLAVISLSLIHLASLARVNLQESRARGELLANAIFHRAREVVPGRSDPYQALAEDPGLRSILESSIYSKNVTYGVIVDVKGVAIAHTDRSREGQPMSAREELDALLDRGALAELNAIYAGGGRTLEVRQPLLLGNSEFGSIRIGVSTLLIRGDLDAALGPAIATALTALLVAILGAALLGQLILRPIHVIRSGLTRLGRGEFGVKLDLPQTDEFGELGSFFNAVSAQLSADRTQLAGQKAKLESVVEHLEDAVAILNPDGELLFANPGMRVALPPEAVGRPVDDLLPADHPYRRLVEETLASGQSRGPLSAPLPAGHEDAGDTRPGGDRLIMTHAITDVDRRLVGVMLVVRNLEYLGRVQSTINYSRKLAALGRLSAGVAHEVKNPLNAITIHLELLKQKLLGTTARGRGGRPAGPAVAPVSASGSYAGAAHGAATVVGEEAGAATVDVAGALQHVTIIAGEIRRLDEVVQGFLKFSRTEDLKLQPVALGTLIEEVRHVVEPEAQKSKVSLVVHVASGLPPINGDPAMLRQAFLNLAINACQAMPEGGTLRIDGSRASDGQVEVRFQDTGVGIEPEHLQKIFDLYFTTKENGSGIGLSMVYRIVQLHDGEVEVQSTPGRGTTFRLLLPQVRQS